MQVLFAILLAIHGFITFFIGTSTVSGAKPISVPGVDWYPVQLGQSWLLTGAGSQAGGVFWVGAGIGLIATAAAVVGIVLPSTTWPTLAVASGVVGLMAVGAFSTRTTPSRSY